MKLFHILSGACVLAASCSGNVHNSADTRLSSVDSILTDINSVLTHAKGNIAVALITPEGDTIAAGETGRQPLMSVFKLHQAIAVAHTLDLQGSGFDTLLHISASELTPSTWSPIVKRHGVADLEMSVDSLLHYLLIYSDNNASNILFDHIVSVSRTDSIVRALTPCHDFQLSFTEREMQLDHSRSYSNAATATDCAVLMQRLWTSAVVSPDKQRRIRQLLARCNSAETRMASAVKEIPDACIAHRTGSGYTNVRGEISTVNDVGIILLPDGRQLPLAILIRDYQGTRQQADSTAAAITRTILSHFR